MPQEYKMGCVLMAAGRAARFGANKLEAEFRGRTLFRRALDAVPAPLFYRTLVVARHHALLRQAEARGFAVCENARPELGASHTIRLALDALDDADALLFLVADQPLLRQESVAAAARMQRENPGCVVALAWQGRRGNPCVFPRPLFPELRALRGDAGGSEVIRRHPDKLLLCPAAGPWELADVDTAEQLARLENG